MTQATLQKPPGPKGIPLVGHLFAFRRDPIRFLMEAARDHGDVVHVRFGPQHAFLLNHPDYIHDVLVTHPGRFIKGRGLEWAKQLLGEGLLTSEGEFHRRQRQLVQPAFHHRRIAEYATVMTDCADRVRDRWRDDETKDVWREMMHLTLTIVAKTVFGTDVESETEEIDEALAVAMDYFYLFLWPFAEWMARLPIPSTRRFRKARKRLDATIYRMINERRANPKDRGDLLSMLLLARDEGGAGGMTDVQLRDEAMTIFLAGHETTANALTWTWYLLSRNPEAEAALHAELDRVLGGRTPTVEDLEHLTYTKKLFSEAMRLYPPAWLLGYRAIQDHTVDRYVLPAGSIILMSQYVMHHDPRYFPDPFRFDPERFSPEAMAGRPRFAYFPFGGGPRSCIGEPFAWMEGILLLTTLAQKWRMRLVPNHPVELLPVITLRPRHGMPMQLQRR